MARKKYRRYSPRRAYRRFRRRGKPKIPLAIVGGVAISVLNARHMWAAPGDNVFDALVKGDLNKIINNAGGIFFGINPDGSINWGHLINTWTPALIGVGVHMTIGRVVNKYLKRVPYVNI